MAMTGERYNAMMSGRKRHATELLLTVEEERPAKVQPLATKRTTDDKASASQVSDLREEPPP